MFYRPIFSNSADDFTPAISLEIVAFTTFFGVAYVLFFPFSLGDSTAPLVLRCAKYLLLGIASILILRRLKFSKIQAIAVAFCSVYALLSIINSQKDLVVYGSRIAYVWMSLALFLGPSSLSLKQRFESRFLFYLAFSCFISIVLLLIWPDVIIWQGDLRDNTPSVSGLLDSPNRFGFLLLLGLSFTYGYGGWIKFLLGCLFIVVIPFTGSLGSVISAQLIIVFLCAWTVLIDRRNVWAYANIACHSVLLLVTTYSVFNGSALFNHLFSTSPNHAISNSITNRISVLERFKDLGHGDLAEFLFGWCNRDDVDLFVFNILQNGGFLTLCLFLALVTFSVRKLVSSARLSSVTPYLVAMVIFLDLIYNNNFWSFPFLLALLLALKFYVLWDNVDSRSSHVSNMNTRASLR